LILHPEVEQLFTSRRDKAIGAISSAIGVWYFSWLAEHGPISSRWLYLWIGVPGCLLFLVLSIRYLLWRHPTVTIGPATLTLRLPSYGIHAAPPVVISWADIVSIRAERISRYRRIVRVELRQGCHVQQNTSGEPATVSIPDYAVNIRTDILAEKLQQFSRKAATQ
jgi:hypothetical protein